MIPNEMMARDEVSVLPVCQENQEVKTRYVWRHCERDFLTHIESGHHF